MDASTQTEVQLANLFMLFTVRDVAQADAGRACCEFGLDVELLDLFKSLTPERIVAIVAHLGHESLFLPRSDLPSLLSLPLPVAAYIVSARRGQPVAAGSGGQKPN